MRNKRTCPERREMIQNLKNLFWLAEPAEVQAGLRWYQEAENWIADLALLTGIPAYHIAGVIAVTSPKQNWDVQKRMIPLMLREWIDNESCVNVAFGFTKTRLAADRILDSGEFDIEGQKTHNFFLNLTGDQDAVTIDRHAYRAAIGKTEIEENDGVPPHLYEKVAEAYRLAAYEMNLTPREFQAIIWVVQRRR